MGRCANPREAMLKAGFALKDENFADFYLGRNPN
jgi:hypothetical protein